MSESKHALSQVFAYGDRIVRTAGTVEAPLFVAKDVCACLALDNYRQALERIPEREKGVTTVDTLGGAQQMLCVTEAGVYRLIFTSRKEEAERFQDWVCGEVLPSIRRTGSYSAPGAAPALNAEQLTAAIVAGVVSGMALQIDTLARRSDFIGPGRAREVKQALLAHARALAKSGAVGSERSHRRRLENNLRSLFGYDGPGSSWEFFPAAGWAELRRELERIRAETTRLTGPAQDPLPFSH